MEGDLIPSSATQAVVLSRTTARFKAPPYPPDVSAVVQIYGEEFAMADLFGAAPKYCHLINSQTDTEYGKQERN